MSKLFAVLAVLLIATGIVLLAVPRSEVPAPGSRGMVPEEVVTIVSQAREIAEKVNAPLSIVFGLVSLVYSRRNYQINKARADAAAGGKS